MPSHLQVEQIENYERVRREVKRPNLEKPERIDAHRLRQIREPKDSSSETGIAQEKLATRIAARGQLRV